MKRSTVLLFALALAFAGAMSGSGRAAYLIPVPPVSGSSSTVATGINDDNVIVGFFADSDGNIHAFNGTLDGSYTTFDVQGATYTEPTSIDNMGDIVGNSDIGAFYGNESGSTAIIGAGRKHKPLPHETANGISNTNQRFVGYYLPKDSDTWTSYYGQSGSYRSDFSLGVQSGSTYANGINSVGAVVGYAFIESDQAYHAFLYQNGSPTFIDYPGAGNYSTVPLAINDNGLVTGTYHNGDKTFGFFYNSKKGTYQSLSIRHSKHTSLRGSNSAGLAAVISDRGSFIYCPYSRHKCRHLAPTGDLMSP